MVPSKRIQQLLEGELSRGHDGRGLGPCGGFSTQYACMCDYHSMPYREEVSWVRKLCSCTWTLLVTCISVRTLRRDLPLFSAQQVMWRPWHLDQISWFLWLPVTTYVEPKTFASNFMVPVTTYMGTQNIWIKLQDLCDYLHGNPIHLDQILGFL